MLLFKGIQKRKARKVLGYIFFSTGIFCLMFCFLIGVFYILHKGVLITSPLGKQLLLSLDSSKSRWQEKFTEECSHRNLTCEHIEIHDDQRVTFFIQKHIVVLSEKKPIDSQMSSLQLTIHQLTMEGKDYHSLDFRYDRPVISY